MEVEVCENCLTEIAPDEQAFVLNNHVVCEKCYKIDYVKVAKFLQYVLFLLLVNIILLGVFLALIRNQEGFPQLLKQFGAIGSVIVFVLSLATVIALMRAMKWHTLNIVLYTIGVFFLPISLPCFLIIIWHVMRFLRLAGYRVRLTGIKPGDMP